MDIDEQDTDYLMHRRKTCPCCRAVILKRPVPVFVVKAIASSLLRVKQANMADGVSVGAGSPLGTDADPWKGLFPDEDADAMDSEPEIWDDVSEDDLGVPIEQLMFGPYFSGEYESASGSGSEEVEEDEEDYYDSSDEDDAILPGVAYTNPRWEPPSFQVDQDARLSPAARALIRRGCTEEMIAAFGMVYKHQQGIIAHVNSISENWQDTWDRNTHFNSERRRRSCRLFLGWNINLRDQNGEEFIERRINDLRENPGRWLVTPRGRGLVDAARLVRRDRIDEYDTTDSEAWL